MGYMYVYVAAGLFVALLARHARATAYKIQLYMKSLLFLFFTSDTRYKLTDIPDPATLDSTRGNVEKRTVIFIRHGESMWNETFNRSKNPIYFVPRLIWASCYEMYLLIKGERDSWFYDSPLSLEGIKQAEQLRNYLTSHAKANNPMVDVMLGKSSTNTILVSSSLRRALSTIVIALWDRLNGREEKIVLLPCLQEISRNMDTLSITPPYTSPIPSWIERDYLLDIGKVYSGQVDVTQNRGNKPVRGTSGLKRVMEFNHWLFNDTKSDEVVIVAGHSLWFRAYFRLLLARSSKHKAISSKIANGGVVSFTVSRIDGNYKVEEDTINEVYKGFDK